METVRPAPVPASSTSSSSSTARSGLLRSVTSKLSRTRKPATTKVSDDAKGANNSTKTAPQQVDDYAASMLIIGSGDRDLNLVKAKRLQQLQKQMLMLETRSGGGIDRRGKDDHEEGALLDGVFARVSAIKMAYAQIQVGQNPYNPQIIQSADLTVVEELRRISKIKHGYYRSKLVQQKLLTTEDKLLSSNPMEEEEEHKLLSSQPMEAQLRANKNLVKAYEIVIKNLEADLKGKDEALASLTQVLQEIDTKNQALKHRLSHPRRYARSDSSRSSSSSSTPPPPPAAISISTLHNVHLSALDPTHFLLGLRYAVRAVRDLVGVLVREMTKAGWDLQAAASAIAPCAPPEATDLAFESYVCMKGMFSDFHLGPGFHAPQTDDNDSTADRRHCFDEFTAALSCDSAKDLARLKRPFADFCRAKYAAIVRPEMEAAVFAGMDRRAMADAELFVAFAEMARRVWLLHWLFCSFEPEAQPYMFRAPPGARFTQVYMDSVASSPDGGVVGFTVVPGFRLRRTVFQCKVYLVAPPQKR